VGVGRSFGGGSLNVPFALVLVLELICLVILVRNTLAAREPATL